MLRRSILILLMCCSCATGFVQMHVAVVSPKMLGLPSRSAAELLPAYARTALMPEITAAANAAEFQSSQTWYVRPDGGTRYSANVPAGQCDGLADVAYPGSGTNQHCAFNDLRFMWDDDSGAVGHGTWVIAGGDTVIIRGCSALPGQQNPANPDCRVGWDQPTGSGTDNKWCYAVGSYDCFNPPIPAGTASQHTRILGQNYAACNTGGATDPRAYEGNLTQLFGGFSLAYTLNLQNTQYVDVQCIEITSHNGACVTMGAPAYPRGCSTSQPLDDYAGSGVFTNNATSNITLQDVYIHGFDSSGLFGPIGGPITMTRMFVGFNTFAGWDFDDGNDTPDGPGSTITATHVIMEGNGCQEQYPLTNTFPALVCYDTNSAGFGDSWSGQDTTLDSFICDDCQDLYNTKDGFIGPHTWTTTLTVTNSTSIGNMGQDWKWGGDAVPSTVTFTNNLTVGNCNRMSQPLPGAPANYNQFLTGFCRASGMVAAAVIPSGSTWTIANNTWVMYQPTSFYLACPTGVAGPCPSTVKFTNNIFLGYFNPAQPSFSGQAPALYYINDPSINLVDSHNVEFGLRNGDCSPIQGTGNICLDPQFVGEPAQAGFVSESTLDNFNFHLTGNSPAIGAGISIPGLTTDYDGVTRSATPSIGALELGSVASSSVALGLTPPVTVPPPTTKPVVTPPATTQPLKTPTVTWVKIANEGNTVTLPAGLTIRFGALAGTSPGNSAVTVPLAADSFDPPITLTATTTFIVGAAEFGGIDPAPNYAKELDIEFDVPFTPAN